MVAELNHGSETVAPPAELRFRAKKGSVFPRQKKLIKRLALEAIVRSIGSLFASSHPSASASSGSVSNIKNHRIFADPDGLSDTPNKRQPP